MSSLAEELLNNMSEDEIEAYTADLATEEHIVVGDDRFITVPESLKRIAVQYDHNIETVIFDCPRFWDGLDMSKMKIYINYMCPDKTIGMYIARNISVDETDSNIMHFSWTISNNLTKVKGDIHFLVCVKKTALGEEVLHWNSELNKDMYVSEGLECQAEIITSYPDVITDLLTRMDYVEDIATPESMQEYINTFFTTGEGTKELERYIYQYLAKTYPTTPDMMQKYINMYLDENPPLFVIGSEKPGVKCLWFNTGTTGTTTNNTILKIAGDSLDGIYAEVTESTEQGDVGSAYLLEGVLIDE